MNRDFSKARSLLAKLLKDDPENTSALDLLADVATRQSDWPLLRATLRRRARIDSNSAIVQNRVGLELINSVRQQRGRQSQTESGIQQATFDFDSDRIHDSANTEPARVIADGITLLHRAVQLEPRNTDFVQHLVGALAQENRDTEALGVIRRALDVNPTNATLAIMAARMLDAKNDWASAIFYYDRALQNDPQNRIWHRHRAMCLYRQGNYAQAAADFEIALPGTPVEFQIAEHLAWANSYLLQGKPELTVQLLNRIIETDRIRTPEIEALRVRCQAQLRVES